MKNTENKNNLLKQIFVLIMFSQILSLSFSNITKATGRCYGGGGSGIVSQTIYGPLLDSENVIIDTNAKLASNSSIALQLFAGCHLNELIDVEVGTILNKKSSLPSSISTQKTTASQKSFTIDAILKAQSFDNGLYLYGKAGGGFFVNRLFTTITNPDGSKKFFINLDDRFGLHLAAGIAYPLNDDVQIRAEYHQIPKGDYYQARPVTINVSYQFD